MNPPNENSTGLKIAFRSAGGGWFSTTIWPNRPSRSGLPLMRCPDVADASKRSCATLNGLPKSWLLVACCVPPNVSDAPGGGGPSGSQLPGSDQLAVVPPPSHVVPACSASTQLTRTTRPQPPSKL